MPEPNQPTKPGPLWLPLASVARTRIGTSPELALAAAKEGQLPLRIVSFGRRGLKFVNRADLEKLEALEGAPR